MPLAVATLALLAATLTAGTTAPPPPITAGATAPLPAATRRLSTAPVLVTAASPVTGLSPAPDLRACYDGACRLSLSRAVSFRVSSRFGITRLAVTFTGDQVKVKGTGPGVSSQARLGAGTTGSVNGIGVQVLSLSADRVVLRLSPRR
ncbi:hypothetical protein [Nonomuraea sp. NPDC003754]